MLPMIKGYNICYFPMPNSKSFEYYIKDGDEPILGNAVSILHDNLLHYCPHCKIVWPQEKGYICPKSKNYSSENLLMCPEHLGQKNKVFDFTDYTLYEGDF